MVIEQSPHWAVVDCDAIDGVGPAIDRDRCKAIRSEQKLRPTDVRANVGDGAVRIEHRPTVVVRAANITPREPITRVCVTASASAAAFVDHVPVVSLVDPHVGILSVACDADPIWKRVGRNDAIGPTPAVCADDGLTCIMRRNGREG